MGAVFSLTLRQLTGRWRLVVMAVLAVLPVLVTLLMLADDRGPSVRDFETAVLSTMLAGSILPLAVLAIAAAAFGNEVEDRTLANLTLSPLPRWHIAAGKLLAAVTVAAPFIVASAAATAWLAFLGDGRAVLAVTVAALVCVALYGAAFTWLGLVSGQAIGVGLLYIILWESLFAGFVQGARLLSIRHWALGLMHGIDPRRFAVDDHLPTTATAAIVAVAFAGFVWLTVRKLRTMDVP